MFRKILSFVMSFGVIFQTTYSCYASQVYKTIEEVEEHLSDILKHKSIPAPLGFQSEPGKTAAGILQYAVRPDGKGNHEVLILFGQRDDTNTYCNFGGKSDDEASEGGTGGLFAFNDGVDEVKGDLCLTAARERCEESNGLDMTHPRLLRKLPFIDTITEKNGDLLYHRMYWEEVPFLDASIYNKELEEASEAHSQEYLTFDWFKARDVLTACIIESPELAEDIILYNPLFQTLCTETGIEFLIQLTKLQQIKPFDTKTRKLKNRLYYVGERAAGELEHLKKDVQWKVEGAENLDKKVKGDTENESVKDFKIRLSPLYDVIRAVSRPCNIGGNLIDGGKGKAEEDSQAEVDVLKKLYAELLIEKDETISLKESHEKSQFAEAVSAHASAVIELKEKFHAPLTQEINLEENERQDEEFDPNSLSLWNPNFKDSVTRTHLRLVLGPEFKEASEFKGDKAQRQADIANLTEYFNRYSKPEFNQKHAKKAEFKRQITLKKSDIELLADAMEYEGQNNWPTFFHAANNGMHALWTAFTSSRKFQSLSPLIGCAALRGTDIYFRNQSTMRQVRDQVGEGNYENGREAQVMCFNFSLCAGRETTESTSSTIEYLCNDHSVVEQDSKSRFEEALALAGSGNPDYSAFYSVFQRHLGFAGGEYGNSILLTCSVNPWSLKEQGYAAHGGGEAYDMELREVSQKESAETTTDKKTTDSALYILHSIQKESERLRNLNEPEKFEQDKQRKRRLFPELNLHIHPTMVFDPAQMQCRLSMRFAPTSLDNFEDDLRKTTWGFMADWLMEENESMPDAFVSPPRIKQLYKMIYENLSGEELQVKQSTKGFEFLIKNGHLSGVKNFIKLYSTLLPLIQSFEDKGKIRLVKWALESGNVELSKYIVEEVFNATLDTLFPQGTHEFYLACRSVVGEDEFSAKELEETWEYFFSHYHGAKIPVDVKWAWINGALDDMSLEAQVKILKLTKKFFPEVLDEALDTFLELNLDLDHIKELLALKIATPQELLVKYSALFRANGHVPMPLCYLNIILLLLQNGANLFEADPETSDPVIFGFALPKQSTFSQESFSTLLSELFKSLNDDQRQQVRTVKNRQDQTFLQYLQSLFIANGSLTVHWVYEWRSIYGNYSEWKKASMSEFLDWRGLYLSRVNFCSADTFNPLLFEHNQRWAMRVRGIHDPSEVAQLLEDCPSVEVLKLMKPILTEYCPADKYDLMKSYLYDQNCIWCEAIKEAYQSDLQEEVERLLENIPLGTMFESDIASLNDRVKKQIEAHRENWDEIEKKWKEDLEKCDGDLEICQYLETMPMWLYYNVKILSSTLTVKDTVKELEEKQSKWLKGAQSWLEKAVNNFDESGNFNEQEFLTFLDSAPLVGCQIKLFGLLMQDKYAFLLPSYLKIVFPEKKTLCQSKHFPCWDETSDFLKPTQMYNVEDLLDKNPNAMHALVQYVGADGESMLKGFSDDTIAGFLYTAEPENIAALLQNCPNIFYYRDGQRDFFTWALHFLPPKYMRDIVLCPQGIKKMGQTTRSGVPYLFYLLDEAKLGLLEEITAKNPGLVDVTTVEGLGFKDILNVAEIPSKVKRWIRRKLGEKK